MEAIRSFTNLIAWQKAFALGRDVFVASKTWPAEERFALTDQVRRSSRSVGANIAEAWAKRRYTAHFLSKLTDADAELMETEHWLLYAKEHGYLSPDEFGSLHDHLREVGRILGGIIAHPEPFLLLPDSLSHSRPPASTR